MSFDPPLSVPRLEELSDKPDAVPVYGNFILMAYWLGGNPGKQQHIRRVCYMLSPVRLSITRVDHSKMVEVRITQFSRGYRGGSPTAVQA